MDGKKVDISTVEERWAAGMPRWSMTAETTDEHIVDGHILLSRRRRPPEQTDFQGIGVIHEVEKKCGSGITSRRSRPAGSTDGTGRRKTPTEQADQRGEVKKKCEVEKNRPVGQ